MRKYVFCIHLFCFCPHSLTPNPVSHLCFHFPSLSANVYIRPQISRFFFFIFSPEKNKVSFSPFPFLHLFACHYCNCSAQPFRKFCASVRECTQVKSIKYEWHWHYTHFSRWKRRREEEKSWKLRVGRRHSLFSPPNSTNMVMTMTG